MGLQPRVKTESEPIPELEKIVQPVGTKDKTGTQINPATEDTSATILAEGLGFSGAVYENENTATDDTVRKFEASSKKLRDVVIQVETNAQLFGNASNQRFKVTAGASMGFTQVDLSTLYFKNAGAGQNGTVRILGVED